MLTRPNQKPRGALEPWIDLKAVGGPNLRSVQVGNVGSAPFWETARWMAEIGVLPHASFHLSFPAYCSSKNTWSQPSKAEHLVLNTGEFDREYVDL